jgi:hypothetical protein
MPGPFTNRLDGTRYPNDEPCQLRLEPHPRDEQGQAAVGRISERLLDRLKYLAVAYELPLLSRLPNHGQVMYPEIQIESIEDELTFLFEIVSDQALLEAIAPLRGMIGKSKMNPCG